MENIDALLLLAVLFIGLPILIGFIIRYEG
jgi:hypothetical protein